MKSDAALWPLLGCQTLVTAGLAISYPFFSLYLHRDRGLAMGWVGFWLFVMMAAGAAAMFLAGELCDTRGPKAVMSAALYGRAAFVAAQAAAVWLAAPIGLIIALFVAGGFVGHFFDPAIRSWIAGRFAPGERTALYGRQRVAVNVGFAAGPALGGLLAAHSYALAFAVSAVFCVASAALAGWGLPADAVARPGARASLSEFAAAARDARFLEFCGWSLAIAAVMSQLVSTLSVHSVDVLGLTSRQVGALFAINGVVVILGVIPAASLRADATAAVALGCLLYAAGYAGVGFATGFWTLAACVVVLTFGEIIVSPRLPAMTADLAPDKMMGRYVGFQGLCFTAGSALGPLIGGACLQYLTPRWTAAPWLVIATMAASAAAGFARFSRFSTTLQQRSLA